MRNFKLVNSENEARSKATEYCVKNRSKQYAFSVFEKNTFVMNVSDIKSAVPCLKPVFELALLDEAVRKNLPDSIVNDNSPFEIAPDIIKTACTHAKVNMDSIIEQVYTQL